MKEENVKVIIYCLIDPFTLKARYIGRTRQSMSKRLQGHLDCAKYNIKFNKRNTHFINWIIKNLKLGKRPIIRKLCEVTGWKNSHFVETSLITKYRERLLNLRDKGPGASIVTEETKRRQKETMAKRKEAGWVNKGLYKKIYAYLEDGTFYKEYECIKDCAIDIGATSSGIYKAVSGKFNHCKKFRFSFEKVDKLDYFKAVSGSSRKIKLIDVIENTEYVFFSLQDCVSFLKLNPYNMNLKVLIKRLSAEKYNSRYVIEDCKTGKKYEAVYNKKKHDYIKGDIPKKLTIDDVIQIRHDYINGCSQTKLADYFNVTCSNINNIVKNKTWYCKDYAKVLHNKNK